MFKFSIIIPCYNIEQNIPALFDMLSIREFSDYEAIFIDDSSKDNTFEILNKTQVLKEEYKNFRIYKTEQNGGPGVARNVGLEHATGEYIIFCDSDDYFDVDVLVKINDFISKHQDADMIISPHKVLKNGKVSKTDKYKLYNDGDEICAEDVLLGNLTPWAKVYKNQIIKENQIIFPARWTGEDACFVVNYLICLKKIYKMDAYYYDYVINNTSITHKKGIDYNLKTTFEILQPIYNKYFPKMEVKMFASMHLLTKAKQMCSISLPSKEIKKWFKQENEKYPKWIKQVNLKQQSFYTKLIYKAMYYNRPLIIKFIMKLRDFIYGFLGNDMEVAEKSCKKSLKKNKNSRNRLTWVLFLGVIPFDKEALTLYLSPTIGQYISYFLNAITLLITLGLIFKYIQSKDKTKKIFGKYLGYFVLLIVLYFLSSLISLEISLSRIFSLVCLIGYYVFCIYNYDDIYHLLSDINTALIVVVITSLILHLMGNPNVLYTENATTFTFKGIAINRNSYAELTMFLLVSSFCLYKKNRKTFGFLFTLIITIFSTLLTRSATATICILLLLLGLIVIDSQNIKKLISFPAFSLIYFVGFVLLILFQNTELGLFKTIAEIFNKDTTFTGRTQLWTATVDAIFKRPFLGYGYDTEILLQYGLKYTDPHNGILYILLTQGFLGLLSFIFVIASVFNNKKGVNLKGNYVYLAMVVFAMVWFVRGLVESGFSYSHFLFWIALIIIDKIKLTSRQN